MNKVVRSSKNMIEVERVYGATLTVESIMTELRVDMCLMGTYITS